MRFLLKWFHRQIHWHHVIVRKNCRVADIACDVIIAKLDGFKSLLNWLQEIET